MPLPNSKVEQIEKEAKHRGENHMFVPMDGDYSSYKFHGFIVERSYIAGAIIESENTAKAIELLQDVIKISDRKHIAWDRAKEFIQQWKEGKEIVEYSGSTFSNPSSGIMLGCISPEARDLLDNIMEEWGKHYEEFKNNITLANGKETEPSIYMFAYWLVRWSGLIQPATK